MKDHFLRSMSPARPARSAELMQRAEQQACLFRVLGNPRRLMVLWLLGEKPMTLDALTDATGWARTTAAHHLRILKFGGLVKESAERGGIQYQFSADQDLRQVLLSADRPKPPAEAIRMPSIE